MPQYAVISVGKDNAYGHPTDTVLSRLRDADVKVYRTDLQGDIVCISDGKKVTMSVDRNPDADTLMVPKETEPIITSVTTKDTSSADSTLQNQCDYVLNTNTKKLHYPTCNSVKQMNDKNKAYFVGTREEVIAWGYDSCGNCHP